MNLNYEGLIPIVGGIYALLIVHGKITASKDPVKFEEWKRKLVMRTTTVNNM